MARRNQNTFMKRQKELKRVRKANEKMARRQGRKISDGETFEGPPPEMLPPTEDESAETAENPEGPEDKPEDEPAADS